MGFFDELEKGMTTLAGGALDVVSGTVKTVATTVYTVGETAIDTLDHVASGDFSKATKRFAEGVWNTGETLVEGTVNTTSTAVGATVKTIGHTANAAGAALKGIGTTLAPKPEPDIETEPPKPIPTVDVPPDIRGDFEDEIPPDILALTKRR